MFRVSCSASPIPDRSAAILIALLALVALPQTFASPGEASASEDLARLETLLEEEELADVAPQALTLLSDIEGSAGAESPDAAAAIDLIVSHWKGHGIEAEQIHALATRAVDIKSGILGPGDPEVAVSLRNEAMLYEWDSELDRAREPFQRAIAIVEQALGPEHPDLARLLSDYATLLWEIDDSPGSREVCERAIAIVHAALGPDDVAQADCLRIIAGHLYRASDYAASCDLAQRRVEILEQHHGPQDPAVASALMSLSNRTVMLGELDETEQLLRRALAINEAAGAGTEAIHFNLGALYGDLGDYGMAKQEYEIAIRLMEEKYPPGHRILAFARVNLGDNLTLIGDLDGARLLLDSSLEIYEQVYGPDDWHVADVLRHLGRVEDKSGNFDRADARYRRALEIVEPIDERKNALAKTLRDIGALRSNRGDLESSVAAYERALSVARDVYGPDHFYTKDYATDLADTLVLLGRTADARPFIEKALEIEKNSVGMDHPATLRTRMSLAALSLKEGDREAALEILGSMTTNLHLFIRNTVAFLPERQAISLMEAREHPEMLLFGALLERGDDTPAWLDLAWTWTLNRRGRVLEELAARNRVALVGESGEARVAWDRLTAARSRLGTLWVSGPGSLGVDQYISLLTDAREEKEKAEIALAKVSRRFRDERTTSEIAPARLAPHLPDGAILVELVRTELGHPASPDRPLHDIALILRADGSADFVDLGPTDSIDRRVARWRQELEAALSGLAAGEEDLSSLDAAGASLREAVWDPIVDRAGKAGIVYFVPEGSLHHVDLAALPTGDGRYLIETGPAIRLLSTGRSLLRADGEDERVSGRGILALGSPDFNADGAMRIAGMQKDRTAVPYRGASPSCALRDMSWAELPAARREVESLEALWKDREPVVLLTGGTASEERFKSDAAGKRLLHLATHGYFLKDRCEGMAGMPIRNPLLMSGLVMAGANRGESPAGGAEDGILTAEELAALDLRGVELAVLSACNTGRGEVTVGEGVFGLRRALEIAGVRSIVMSLWPVPDRQASRWMARFYQEQLNGTGVQKSTRRASLASLRALRETERPVHPYFWAGFVATGEPD